MGQAIALESPPKLNINNLQYPSKLNTNKLQHPFIEELIRQIRLADSFGQYDDWSDELMIEQLIISTDREKFYAKNSNFEILNQLLTNAFYKAIGKIIENKTGHATEIFVHLKSKEFNSAVISCGGVIVLYSLIWGCRSLSFLSLSELIESAETNIGNAVNKASLYLNFCH